MVRGSHTGAGGGNLGGLSQSAFFWMISRIHDDGLLGLDEKFIQDTVIAPIKEISISPWELTMGFRNHAEGLIGGQMKM